MGAKVSAKDSVQCSPNHFMLAVVPSRTTFMSRNPQTLSVVALSSCSVVPNPIVKDALVTSRRASFYQGMERSTQIAYDRVFGRPHIKRPQSHNRPSLHPYRPLILVELFRRMSLCDIITHQGQCRKSDDKHCSFVYHKDSLNGLVPA